MGAAPIALERWLTLAPRNSHYETVSNLGATQRLRTRTGYRSYAEEESRHGGQDGQGEEQRDDLRRVLGVGAENVVYLRLLAVAKRRFVARKSGVRVSLEFEIEGGRNKAFGSAEGGDDNRSLQGLLGEEQLGGNVLGRLQKYLVSMFLGGPKPRISTEN
jgi:hypothetical protein